MDNELDKIKMRLGMWCSTLEREIEIELSTMGENIENFPFIDINELPYVNCAKNTANWIKETSALEQNLSEFAKQKCYFLRKGFSRNKYAQVNLQDGTISDAIYYLDEAVLYLSLALRLRDDQASLDQAKSILAKRSAEKRHAPTYELRDQVVAHWSKNIGADISNELAAELLQKEFPDLSHRTLVGYVA